MLSKIRNHRIFQNNIEWVSDLLLILFMLLITLGSYIKIKYPVVIVYLVIAVFLAVLNLRRMAMDFIHSPLMICWLLYCVVGLLSTIFIEKESDMYIVYTQISFTFIVFVLTRYMDIRNVLRMFRLMMLILASVAFFQEISGIYVFKFLKEGTPFPYVDIWTRGITSLFEYRHYFGCYLLLAYFSIIYYPEKRRVLNWIYGAVFVLAIVLTYTRCIWIAFIAGTIAVLIRVLIDRYNAEEKKARKIQFRPIYLIPILGGAAAITLLIILFRAQIALVFSNIVSRITSAVDPQNESIRNRLFSIQHGTAYILSDWQHNIWIGMGNGSSLKWLQTAEGAVFRDAIDCQYVQTFMETGIIGLGSLIAMIVYCVNYFTRSPDRKTVLFSLCFLLMAIAYFFFEVIVVNSSVFALWMIVLMILCTGLEGKKSIAEETVRRHNNRRRKTVSV